MTTTTELAGLMAHTPTDADRDEIRATVLDYYEGWFTGDTARMERALHPELAKRALWRDAAGGEVLRTTTAARMAELTAQAAGVEDTADGRIDIRIDDVHGAIATVTAGSAVYVDYLHLARTDEGWRIVNALWTWQDLTRCI
jgi:hypothetical protein